MALKGADPFFYNNKLKEEALIAVKRGTELVQYLKTQGEVDCATVFGEVLLCKIMPVLFVLGYHEGSGR